MTYLDQPFKTFLNDLASSKPTPGGGGVAATTLIQSIGLTLMACGLSQGKKEFESIKEHVQNIETKAQKLYQSLLNKPDSDADIFNRIMHCYKTSSDQLQDALLQSAEFCHSVFQDAKSCFHLAKSLIPICNVNIVSDVAIAVELSIAGAKSARINVRVNLYALKENKQLQNTIQNMETNMNLTLKNIESEYPAIVSNINSRRNLM